MTQKLVYNYYFRMKPFLNERKDSILRHFRYPVKPITKYGGGIPLSNEEVNQYIYGRLNDDRPFLASRFGSVEIGSIVERQGVLLGAKKLFNEDTRQSLFNNAGFFPYPTDNAIDKFSEVYESATELVDLLGVWFFPEEEYYLRQNCSKKIRTTKLGNLEPWNAKCEPWSRGLKGKKVLFVHPYEDTIMEQIPKRETIFPGTDILPEMQVSVLKAVQTIAGTKDPRFENWFDALDWMHEETRKIDFDIAIIGCGAYGLPLGARIKQDGRKAIHLGGATQLFWGIRGKRWDDRPDFQRLFNDAWVHPLESDCPENRNNVEGGCYW